MPARLNLFRFMTESSKKMATKLLGSETLLDSYTRRARLQPAFLAILPIGIAALVWFPKSLIEWGVFAGLLTSAGGTALLARLARIRGKKLELRLFELWGGKPTTVALRHRDAQNPVLLERRHTQLSRIANGLHIPREPEERENPQAADAAYDTCVAVLIERTRDRKSFPLLFEENCHYGFWRNLLGLRPLGIATSFLGTIAIAFLIYRKDLALDFKTALGGAIDLALLASWLFLVRPHVVKMAAESYRDRLLGACEELDVGIK
jgi:hypothetical protein